MSESDPPGDDTGLEIPDLSRLVLDDDLASPIAATVVYDHGPVERIVLFGPKPATSLPPTSALVYVNDSDEVVRMDFDSDGVPTVAYLGEAGELHFGFSGSTVGMDLVTADGTTELGEYSLEVRAENGDEPQGMRRTESNPGVDAVPGSLLDMVVDIDRAVFVDVTVESSAGPLPNYFSEPFLHTDGCHAQRAAATFTCSRVAPQLIESGTSSRLYRLPLAHTVSASAPGVEESMWPSEEACQAALGDDWLGWASLTSITTGPLAEAGVSAYLKAKTGTELATVLTKFLPAAAVPVAKALAVSAAVFGGGLIGKMIGDQIYYGGENHCERISKQVGAIAMLGQLVTDITFTVEACLSTVEGWTIDPECQEIGPFQPFSTETDIVPGDAATLDRNRLPSITFIAIPDPGSIAGRVVDAESGEAIAGASLILTPSGLGATTDASGAYKVTDVPVGPQTITVSADGYAEGTATVEVQTDETTELTISLEEGAITFPITFTGTGTNKFSSDFTVGECVTDARMTVTLLPDGSVEGTIDGSSHTFTFDSSDGIKTLKCLEENPWTTGLIGTHEAGSIKLIATTQPDEVWLQGNYQLDQLTINERKVSQVSADVTITYFSDWVFLLEPLTG